MSRRGIGFVLIALAVVLALSSAGQAALVVGSWDVARGGFDSISDAPEQAAGRAAIQAFRPDATFSSTNVRTDAYLSGVDIFALGGQTSDTTAVTPLSAAEQSALLNLVLSGGNAIIFTDNDELDLAIGDA